MKEVYREAFSEIEQIIKLMPESLSNKIPLNFKQIIASQKSKTYNPVIQEPFEECNIMEETSVILAVIYRDFLCDEEDRKKLEIRDSKKIEEYEVALAKLKDEYDIDNVFKKRCADIVENNISNEENSLIKIEEKNFLQKIFDKIKKIFSKN